MRLGTATMPHGLPGDLTCEGVQAGLHQKHHDAGNFSHRRMNVFFVIMA
jgi:hypothetical protein